MCLSRFSKVWPGHWLRKANWLWTKVWFLIESMVNNQKNQGFHFINGWQNG